MSTLITGADFDGATYQREFDFDRLTGQIRRVYDCMRGGAWRTLGEIATITGDPEASVSAQLRHLRKAPLRRSRHRAASPWRSRARTLRVPVGVMTDSTEIRRGLRLGSEPAFPSIAHENGSYTGLSKRDLIAAMMLQGVVANPNNAESDLRLLVDASMRLAEGLLEELAK